MANQKIMIVKKKTMINFSALFQNTQHNYFFLSKIVYFIVLVNLEHFQLHSQKLMQPIFLYDLFFQY